MTKIQAVVFDLDGLLIDSEVVWNAVRHAVAAERGVDWTTDDQRAVMGVSTAAWTAYMIDRLGLDLTPEAVRRAVVERMVASYRERVPFKPGAAELVKLAGDHYPLALASGSVRELIDLVVGSPEFAGRFGVVVSADEVARGKPHADVFLEAARRLGVPPEACVCLEDSGHASTRAKPPGCAWSPCPTRASCRARRRSGTPTSG